MKTIYRKIIEKLQGINIKVYKLKVWTNEWIAILRKKSLYKNIKYSSEQDLNIEKLWKDNYGKSISNRWHKLYESINGVYDECYFPEIIFSTKLEPKLNPINIAKFLSDKSLTELLYRGVADVQFPETIVVNSNDFYYDKSRNIIKKNKVMKILMDKDEFVIKPILGGSSGQDVQVINFKDTKKSDKDKLISSLLKTYNKNYIIQHKLNACLEYSSLYPTSINTMRLITYIANDTVYHAPLCLRMGQGGKSVDNIHSGGIVVGVSDEGRLKKYAYQLGFGDSKVKHSFHPDTNIIFKDYKVPMTQEMIKIAKQLHGNTPHLGIISWDFMINDRKEVVIVEGNYFGQSIWFPQIVHGEPIFGKNTEYMMNLINKNKS